MNISTEQSPKEPISRLFAIIGQPVRIQILAILASQPACVCHFEAVLGLRQASISQHLMILRKAGLVTTQREGRNIFYHLAQPGLMAMIEQAASLSGGSTDALKLLARRPVPGCPCPQCNPNQDPTLSCTSLNRNFPSR